MGLERKQIVLRKELLITAITDAASNNYIPTERAVADYAKKRDEAIGYGYNDIQQFAALLMYATQINAPDVYCYFHHGHYAEIGDYIKLKSCYCCIADGARFEFSGKVGFVMYKKFGYSPDVYEHVATNEVWDIFVRAKVADQGVAWTISKTCHRSLGVASGIWDFYYHFLCADTDLNYGYKIKFGSEIKLLSGLSGVTSAIKSFIKTEIAYRSGTEILTKTYVYSLSEQGTIPTEHTLMPTMDIPSGALSIHSVGYFADEYFRVNFDCEQDLIANFSTFTYDCYENVG